MEHLFYLIAAYGITFGMQHKALFLRDKNPWVDKMLVCTYCVGFHAGWITWLLWKIDSVINGSVWGFELLGMLLFAMASSAFSYIVDTSVRLMESHADPVVVAEEDEEDLPEEESEEEWDEAEFE